MLTALLSLTKASKTQAQGQPINLNGGLQAQVVSAGRDKTFKNLTASMTLTNKGKNTVYVLLLTGSGYPKAIDNTGTTFLYGSVGGIPVCPSTVEPQCIGVPDVINGTPPLQNWLELDPGTSPATLNFQLFIPYAYESHGSLASLSCTLAYRTVSDPTRDDALTDKQKRQQIHLMNLSFPMTPVFQQE